MIAGNVWSAVEPNDSIRVNYCKRSPGGHANNQSLALRKLGKKVRFIGRVGSDDFGLTIVGNLRDAGVDVSNAIIDPTLETSVSVIIIDGDGEKTIFMYQTGNNAFSIDHIKTNWMDDCAVLSIGNLWTLPGLDGSGMVALLSKAKDKGIITVADTSADSKHIGIEPLVMALKHTDYYMVGQREARALTGCDELHAAAEALLEMGPKGVIIRMGAQGCLVATGEKKVHLSTISVKAVDTSGASDSFTAGFITKLCEGKDIFTCAAFGNVAGALCTLAPGATKAHASYHAVSERFEPYFNALNI